MSTKDKSQMTNEEAFVDYASKHLMEDEWKALGKLANDALESFATKFDAKSVQSVETSLIVASLLHQVARCGCDAVGALFLVIKTLAENYPGDAKAKEEFVKQFEQWKAEQN